MLRGRVRARRFLLADGLLRTITALLALALIWYGAMTVLLALKASPHGVNGVSAYHTIYTALAEIRATDITAKVRTIVAISGVACFLILAPLAWRALPRPYRTRGGVVDLSVDGDRGTTMIAPRVIERAVEVAALAHPAVVEAAGRCREHDVSLAVTVREAGELPDMLTAIQARVVGSLATLQLPRRPINVTLAGFDRSNQRKLAR
ncbi:MAG: hypothetical protein ACR2LV_02200 [Solirubrobacteraceae bacterium]